MLDPARLVFIDETAVSTHGADRGRAPRGVRVIGHVPLGEWKTIMGTRQQRNSRVRTGG